MTQLKLCAHPRHEKDACREMCEETARSNDTRPIKTEAPCSWMLPIVEFHVPCPDVFASRPRSGTLNQNRTLMVHRFTAFQERVRCQQSRAPHCKHIQLIELSNDSFHSDYIQSSSQHTGEEKK